MHDRIYIYAEASANNVIVLVNSSALVRHSQQSRSSSKSKSDCFLPSYSTCTSDGGYTHGSTSKCRDEVEIYTRVHFKVSRLSRDGRRVHFTKCRDYVEMAAARLEGLNSWDWRARSLKVNEKAVYVEGTGHWAIPLLHSTSLVYLCTCVRKPSDCVYSCNRDLIETPRPLLLSLIET